MIGASPLDAGRLHVFSDFDGTISEPDTLVFLALRLGGGAEHVRESERLLRDGRLSPREVIARDLGGIAVPFAEAARVLREHVAVDRGFPGFARWCAARNVPLTVLSAGFEEIIALFLPPAAFPGLRVRANRLELGTDGRAWRCVFRDASPFGHDKALAVREARARGAYTVFIGDGISDREPAAVADEVFARAASRLAAHCHRRALGCTEFDTFDDVLRNLKGRLGGDTRALGGAS
jgi:2,3-diketo-5-methylthio-1-phosphopentane phosphatase